MNLILILKELWRRRLLVGLALLLAIAIPILAVFKVSAAPPSISKRSHVDAQGSIEILVDSARSPIADAHRDLTGLSTRAGVFARLMAGGNVVREIAEEAGVPFDQIDVAGPAPLPGEAPGASGESPQIHPYGLAFSQTGELPIVKVATRAPTLDQARALAAAAPGAVRKVVQSIQAQQGTPAAKRVEFRVLGPAEAAPMDEALGKKVALVLFVVILAIGIALILGVPRLRAAWHAAEPSDPAPAGRREPDPDREQDDPDVVRLPVAREDDPADEVETAWIGRRQEP